MSDKGILSAYLLHRRPYRESSWLLECFSKELGRLSVIGRSQGKKNGKGILQPFTPIEIQLGGRGNLKYLRQFEAQSLAIPLQGEALYCGLYLNELLYHLLQAELPLPALYQSYQESLIALAKTSLTATSIRSRQEQILRAFEFSLLGILGYQLELDQSQGQPLNEQRYYHYIKGDGLVPAHASHGRSQAFTGAELLAISKGEFNNSTQLKTAKQITRIALQPLLNGRELKSRQLFKKMY